MFATCLLLGINNSHDDHMVLSMSKKPKKKKKKRSVYQTLAINSTIRRVKKESNSFNFTLLPNLMP